MLLGLSALSVLPINWLGAALLLLAFTLFVLEAKFATHGILGAGGAVSMVLGAVMLIDSPLPEMRIHLVHRHRAGAAVLAHHGAAALAGGARARATKWSPAAKGMIGEIGAAVTPLAPDGKVFVHGEYWNAVARRAGGRRAAACASLAIDQLKLTVEPVRPTERRLK